MITETPHDQNTTVQQDAIESRATLTKIEEVLDDTGYTVAK